MSAGELPKWVWSAVILSPAIPIIVMGVVHVAENGESWTGFVPFVLIAAFAVAVMLAVYGARDKASTGMAPPQRPMTRWQFRRYVLVLAFIPVALLTAAVVALVNRWWLEAGVFLALVIPPTLLHTFAIQVARTNRQSSEAGSEVHKRPDSEV